MITFSWKQNKQTQQAIYIHFLCNKLIQQKWSNEIVNVSITSILTGTWIRASKGSNTFDIWKNLASSNIPGSCKKKKTHKIKQTTKLHFQVHFDYIPSTYMYLNTKRHTTCMYMYLEVLSA